MTSLLRLEESSVGRTTDISLVNVEGKGCITLTQDCYFTIKIKKKSGKEHVDVCTLHCILNPQNKHYPT